MNNKAKVVIEKPSPNDLNIAISGRFDYTTVPEFKSLYGGDQVTLPPVIVIDLTQTESIDSTALGMLLMLRRRAGGDLASITLKNPNEDIIKILSIAHLDSMFQIEKDS